MTAPASHPSRDLPPDTITEVSDCWRSVPAPLRHRIEELFVREIARPGGAQYREALSVGHALLRSIGASPPVAEMRDLSVEAWHHEWLPTSLPRGWRVVEMQRLGAAYQNGRLHVIASSRVETDGRRWAHVSMSFPDRLPSWEDVKRVRDAILGPTRTAVHVVPPASEHYNVHSYCLHLWHCLDGDTVPDFTRGIGGV